MISRFWETSLLFSEWKETRSVTDGVNTKTKAARLQLCRRSRNNRFSGVETPYPRFFTRSNPIQGTWRVAKGANDNFSWIKACRNPRCLNLVCWWPHWILSHRVYPRLDSFFNSMLWWHIDTKKIKCWLGTRSKPSLGAHTTSVHHINMMAALQC